jgi:hypothetical protein
MQAAPQSAAGLSLAPAAPSPAEGLLALQHNNNSSAVQHRAIGAGMMSSAVLPRLPEKNKLCCNWDRV